MSLFTQFCRSYGQGTNCQAVSGETTAKYRGRLPEELLQFWQENGWCAYGNGMFWLVNPDVYSDVLPDWFDTSETPIDAIARTAWRFVSLVARRSSILERPLPKLHTNL